MGKKETLELNRSLDRKDTNKEHQENASSLRNQKRVVLSGQGISPGIACGRAFLYTDILTRDLQVYSINKKDCDDEMDRIHSAIDTVYGDLDKEKDKVEEQTTDNINTAIFEAHQEILKDKQLTIDLAEELESELINAEIVVRNVFRKLANKLRASKDEVFSSKADDLDDISRKILRVLVGYESNILEFLPSDSIIVAKRLLPSDTVHLKRENLKGIVVEEGSTHSHSALLSRAFGITAVANIKDLVKYIHNGDELLVDGYQGTIIVHPTNQDKKDFNKRNKIQVSRIQELSEKAKKPALTKCGQAVKIYANAYSQEDFKMAYENGCDGIGLFRMEQLYMSRQTLPNEEEIFKQLKNTFQSVPGKEITIRLLDIGGDKRLPYLNIKKERNPFLGLRGVRFLLKHKDILKTQLRAILRLSELYPIRLLIPMVTLNEEVKEIKRILKECRKELSRSENKEFPDIPVGIMIETPAAVFLAQKLAEHVDFFSIGTNDLLQYVMAAGRENSDVATYYEKGMDLIMDIIAGIINEGQQTEMEVSLCGELAGDLDRTEELLSRGIRCFSVSPSLIPELKEKISTILINKNYTSLKE